MTEIAQRDLDYARTKIEAANELKTKVRDYLSHECAHPGGRCSHKRSMRKALESYINTTPPAFADSASVSVLHRDFVFDIPCSATACANYATFTIERASKFLYACPKHIGHGVTSAFWSTTNDEIRINEADRETSEDVQDGREVVAYHTAEGVAYHVIDDSHELRDADREHESIMDKTAAVRARLTDIHAEMHRRGLACDCPEDIPDCEHV